MNGEPVLRY